MFFYVSCFYQYGMEIMLENFISLTYMFKYILSYHICDNKLNSEGR